MTTNNTRYSIGVDPDLRTMTFALVSRQEGQEAKLEGLWTAKSQEKEGKKYVHSNEEAVVAMLDKVYGPRSEITMEALNGNDPSNYITVVVESQNVTYTGRTNTARPQPLIYLAQVAGGVASSFCRGYLYRVKIVQPSKWKGSTPKKICQARAYKKLGLEYEVKGGTSQKGQYCVPLNFKQFDKTNNLNAGDFKDAGDSIALAVWGLDN